MYLVHLAGRVALHGQQRRGQRGEQPQLKLGGVLSRRLIVGQLKGTLQRVDRFGVGMQPLGGLSRPLVPADGLGGRAGESGSGSTGGGSSHT